MESDLGRVRRDSPPRPCAPSARVGAEVDEEGEGDEEPLKTGHVVSGAPAPECGEGQRRPGQEEEPKERDDPAVERTAEDIAEDPQQHEDEPRRDQREQCEQATHGRSIGKPVQSVIIRFR